jgi:hypothetical protein
VRRHLQTCAARTVNVRQTNFMNWMELDAEIVDFASHDARRISIPTCDRLNLQVSKCEMHKAFTSKGRYWAVRAGGVD